MTTAPNAGSSGGGFDVQKVTSLFLRHFWVILITFVVVTVCGFMFFRQQQAAQYEASTVLMVRPAPVSAIGGGDDVMSMWAAVLDWQRYRSTQLKVMTSTVILSKVAKRLDLENDIYFPNGPSEDDSVVQEPKSLKSIVNILKKTVTVEQDGDTMMVRISARCTVPHYCSDIVNALAKTYMEFNVEQRVGSGIAAENWLRAQYKKRKQELEDAEEALIAFRAERNLISVSLEDQYNITGRNLSSLASKLIESQYEVDSLKVTMDEIARVRKTEDYLSAGLTEVIGNSVVQGLKQQLVTLDTERASLGVTYGDEHPLMKANAEKRRLVMQSLEREIDADLSSSQLQYDTAQSLVSAIKAKMNETYEEAMTVTDEKVLYERLSRAAEMSRNVVDKIEGKLYEVELSNQLEPQNLQVMENADVPTTPLFNKSLPTTLIAAGLGLVLGLGLAFLLEMLDTTVRTHEQIEDELELTFLGIVPRIGQVRHSHDGRRGPKKGEEYNPDTYVHDYPRSAVAEAVRSIRTNLSFMMAENELRLIQVTSTSPLEGKSTFAVSLATTLAQIGHRVVLVDNDLRKARLHKTLEIDATEGLTSVVAGERSLDEVLRPCQIPGVMVLPCGPIPSQPTEMMALPAYTAVLDDLKSRFDIVVLDAAPVEPVTDSVLLAQKVDGVILIARAGKTKRALLRRTRDKLDAVAAPIVGVVLNDVDVTSRAQGYYYTYGYYGLYYGTPEHEVA